YAQQAATKWGAKRFALEFERREQEERWLRADDSNTSRAPGPTHKEDAPEPPMLSGLVDAAVQERVVGSDREEFRLNRPKYERHSSVPRPPAPEPHDDRGRARRRRRERPSHTSSSWVITPAEAARMSPAGRRLYGLDDPPSSDRG
ncbi:MAG: hypothetical protein M3M93_04885, partial [Actinomycetota bacterium]|nr:hypothetical protein [Actinomycetota bacterium]